MSGLNNIIDAGHSHVTTNLQSAGRLKDFLEFGLTIEKDRIARTQVSRRRCDGERRIGGDPNATPDPRAVDHWKNPDFVGRSRTKATDPAKVTLSVYNGRRRSGSRAALTSLLTTRRYLDGNQAESVNLGARRLGGCQ